MSESEQKFYQQSPIQGVDWPEDFDHENGNYMCECCDCCDNFYGHKRRVICKKCATKPEEQRDETPFRFCGEHVKELIETFSKKEEQRDKTFEEIYSHISKCLPFASGKAKHQQGLEAVASEAVRRAKDKFEFKEGGKLREVREELANLRKIDDISTDQLTKKTCEIAKQAEQITALQSELAGEQQHVQAYVAELDRSEWEKYYNNPDNQPGGWRCLVYNCIVVKNQKVAKQAELIRVLVEALKLGNQHFGQSIDKFHREFCSKANEALRKAERV